MKQFLSISIIILALQNVFAQSPFFQSYSLLKKNEAVVINKILQDKTGFIWLGTNKGLFKFDGIRYRRFLGIDNLPGAVPLETYDLPRECVLVFGQEGPGLSADVRAVCTAVLSIAQYGSTRSINAGAAAAIAMHAWVRRYEFGQSAEGGAP